MLFLFEKLICMVIFVNAIEPILSVSLTSLSCRLSCTWTCTAHRNVPLT